MVRDPLRAKAARFLARTVRTRTAIARHPAPVVSFTFDDVHGSAATAGAAILERHGARGTFYVAGSLVGTEEPDRRTASLDQCRDLHRRGHELGCHTYAHVAVASHSRAGLAADIARNAAFFAKLGGDVRIENFAYPFNATSLGAKRRLERAFTTCRGGIPGINAGRVDLGFLRAVEIHDDGIDAARVGNWIDAAKRGAGWLIFFTHGVQEGPQPWRCTPGLLEAAVVSALDAGCEVLTVADAARRLGFDPAAGRRHDAEAPVDQ